MVKDKAKRAWIESVVLEEIMKQKMIVKTNSNEMQWLYSQD